MSEPAVQQSCEPALPLLGRALAAAVVGNTLSTDARGVLSTACFRSACSVRAALPLDGQGHSVVLVSSDLRAPTTPPTYWATSRERSLVGHVLATSRSAAVEGPAIHQLADLKQLAADGSGGSFVCVPLLEDEPLLAAEAGPAVAALLLCFPASADIPQEDLRLALLVAAQLTRKHGRELAGYVGRLHEALHPAEHQHWGPGFDPEYPLLPPEPYRHSVYPDSADSEDSEDSEFSTFSGSSSGATHGTGGGGLSPQAEPAGGANADMARRRPGARWTMSARTLRFEDEKAERHFQKWRNTRLAKMDTAALLALLVYHLASCIVPPTAGCHPAPLSACLPAALTVAVPLLLLSSNRSTRWYSRHRDQLLICTYILLACHQALDAASQQQAAGDTMAAREGLWDRVAACVESLWCVGLGIVLQVQFVGQCLMLAGGLALKALVQPGCAGRLASPTQASSATPAAPLDFCVLDSIANACRPLLLYVLLPCCVAYYTELCARRAFCRKMAQRNGSRR